MAMNCPACEKPMATAVMDGRPAWYCYPCSEVLYRQTTGTMNVQPREPLEALHKAAQQAFAANHPRQTPKAAQTPLQEAFGGSEAALVTAIVKALRKSGRTVLRVGQHRADMAGTTVGTPDLFCWVGCGWIGLECKTKTGRLSPEQRRLAAAGMVRVVRSVEEALEIVEEESRNL